MSEFKRNLAVVIGINNYQNGIDKLNTAVPDAVAIAEILQNIYNYELIHPDFSSGVMVNQYATKDKLKTLLTAILPNKIKPTKSDRLIFYFAGHGIARNTDDEPQGFLVPQDANMKRQDSLLRMSDVHDWLAELECKHLLVILDCCFAGAFRWASYRKLIPIANKITKAHYDRFIRFPAWQVLTSASHDQEALEFLNNRDIEQNKKHSPFAAGLIEALQQGKGDINNNGVIIATELYQYLRDYVEKNSKDRQTPGFFPLRKHDRGEYLFKLPDTPLNLRETPELNQDNNPYRGLEPFEAEHYKLFFGRDEIIEQLSKQIHQLNNQLTIVTGISGSGKSSLVKAGLIPYLQNHKHNEWLIFNPIRPGTNPYAALGRAVSQLDRSLFERTGDTTLIDKQLQNNSSKLIKAIDAWSKRNPDSRLLLIIDQFEELITMTPREKAANKIVKQTWLQTLSKKIRLVELESEPDKLADETEKWTEFIKLLVEILDRCPQLSLIITLRSDFEPRFQESAFKSNWPKARFVVRPMRSDELREAVEKPAAEKALYFEPPELVDRLVDEVSQMPGALPLLSFTLSEMYIQLFEAWRDKGKSDRALTVTEDFEQKGGVAGALTRRANEEFRNLPSPKKAHRLTMQRVMLRMVELEGGEAVRRRVLKSELTYPSDEENKRVEIVLAKLQQARLIVTGTDAEANEPYYEPAHDYLVRGWERLQVWINKEQDNLTLQRLLTPTAKAWQDENTGLWDNDSRLPRLKEIQDKDTSDENWLNKIESEFVTRSISRKKNRQVVLTSASFVVVSFLTIVTLNSKYSAQKAQLEQRATNIRAKLSVSNQIDLLLESIQSVGTNYQFNQNWFFHPNRWFKSQTQLLPEVQSVLYQAVDKIREKSSFEGHRDRVNSVAISPDGKYIVSGGGREDKTIKLWDVKQQSLIHTFEGHQDRVNSVAISHDGKYIVSGGNGKGENIKLWEIQKKSLLHTFEGHQKAVNSIAISHDGKYIVSGGNGKGENIKLWEIKQPSPLHTFEGHQSAVNSVAISPDGKYIVSGGGRNDKTIKLWDIKKQSLIHSFEGHLDAVTSVAISHDNKYIVSASGDTDDRNISRNNTIKLWNVERRTLLHTFKGHRDTVSSIAISNDNKYIASGSWDSKVKLWSVEDKNLIRIFNGHRDRVSSVAFNRDSKHLITGSWDKTIKLWDLKENQALLQNFKAHEDRIRSLAFSHDGKYLVTGSRDNTAKLWNVGNIDNIFLVDTLKDPDTKKNTTHDNIVTSVAFSNNSKYIATGSRNNRVKLWNTANSDNVFLIGTFKDPDANEKNHKIKDKAHIGWISSLAFSPDNKYIITGSRDKTIKLWDLKKRELIDTFEAHQKEVSSVAFSHDGKYIVSGSWNSKVKLWNIQDLENISWKTFNSSNNSTASVANRIHSVAFNPNNKNFASGGWDWQIRLWDKNQNQSLLHTFNGHKDRIYSLAFSPKDGKYLISGSWDNTIKLWDVKNKFLLHTFNGHRDGVHSVVFSPNGNYFASGSWDKEVRFWEIPDLHNRLEIACKRIRLNPILVFNEIDSAPDTAKFCMKHGKWSDSEKAEFVARRELFLAKKTVESQTNSLEEKYLE